MPLAPSVPTRTRHRQVNLEGTRRWPRAAGRAGVRRRVPLQRQGDGRAAGGVRRRGLAGAADGVAYGQAKRAAEDALQAAAERWMPRVCLRLAMVYGAGGRAATSSGWRRWSRRVFPLARNRQPALAGASTWTWWRRSAWWPSTRGRAAIHRRPSRTPFRASAVRRCGRPRAWRPRMVSAAGVLAAARLERRHRAAGRGAFRSTAGAGPAARIGLLFADRIEAGAGLASPGGSCRWIAGDARWALSCCWCYAVTAFGVAWG